MNLKVSIQPLYLVNSKLLKTHLTDVRDIDQEEWRAFNEFFENNFQKSNEETTMDGNSEAFTEDERETHYFAKADPAAGLIQFTPIIAPLTASATGETFRSDFLETWPSRRINAENQIQLCVMNNTRVIPVA